MPHIVVLYTSNLEVDADIPGLCRALADTLLVQRDEAGKAVFPKGGTRVFALPSAHHAVSDGGAAGLAADGDGDYGFVYVNLRMGAGRSAAVQQAVGDALSACIRDRLASLVAARHVGITLQIDQSPGQVYDAKLGNLHGLFPA